MNSQIENIIKVFNSFHDGVASYLDSEGLDQIWKVECEYLAQEIDIKYDKFWLKLLNVKEVRFRPWESETKLSQAHWSKLEFEILNAILAENQIKLNWIASHSNANEGGNLFFKIEEIKIYDEKWNNIEVEKLLGISQQYWDNLKSIDNVG